MTPSERMTAELWLASRMKEHGIFEGVTTAEDRKEKFRAACLQFPCVIVGHKNGKPESYAQCFERIFDEPLTPASKVRSKGTESPTAQSAPDASGAVG